MTSISSAVLFTGPMFVGKTTTMFGAVAEHANQGARSVIIKHGMDIRGSHDTIFTHNGDKQNSAISIIVAVSIQEALRSVHDKVTVVGVDEGQFFPDLCDVLELVRRRDGILLYVSALSEDFLQRPFASVEELIRKGTHALSVVALTGRCMGTDGCSNPSEHSIRSTKDGRLVVVGGSELYKAVCRSCLLNQNTDHIVI